MNEEEYKHEDLKEADDDTNIVVEEEPFVLHVTVTIGRRYLVDQLPKFEDFHEFDYLDETDELQKSEGRSCIELAKETSDRHRVEQASERHLANGATVDSLGLIESIIRPVVNVKVLDKPTYGECGDEVDDEPSLQVVPHDFPALHYQIPALVVPSPKVEDYEVKNRELLLRSNMKKMSMRYSKNIQVPKALARNENLQGITTAS